MTIISDMKIDFMSKPLYVKLFILTSSIVKLFDILISVIHGDMTSVKCLLIETECNACRGAYRSVHSENT